MELLDAALPGVVGGFTTRRGGASAPPRDGLNLALHVGDDPAAVTANRLTVSAWFGARAVAYPEQVHGSKVAVASAAPETEVWVGGGGADAVVTAQPGLPVGVLVADCMPVLFADPVAQVVGAAHAGRRGLASGILQATLAAMADLGADPARTAAVVGPSICGRCYEVPAEMRDEVDALVPGTACETASGTPGLDLQAGALGVLRAAGVAVDSIDACTAEDARFFSFRRDAVTGRFAGIVMLAPHA